MSRVNRDGLDSASVLPRLLPIALWRGYKVYKEIDASWRKLDGASDKYIVITDGLPFWWEEQDCLRGAYCANTLP